MRLDDLDVQADGAAVLAGAPAAKVVRLVDVEAERVQWLWPGYLPLGKLVVLDGDPGVGKSTVCLDIAARLTTGSPMPDGSQGAKGTVLVLSAEDGLADTIRPRLDAAQADSERVLAVTEIGEGEHARPVSLPGDLPVIEQVITGNEVKLVIVDVLMAFLAGEVNANRDQDIRRALHVLSALAERTRCCVVVLRHLNKSGGANALYRGGGSIGIIGAARAGFICGRDPDDEFGNGRVFANVKMNIAAEPPSLAYQLVYDELHDVATVRWDGAIAHRATDLLGEFGADDRSERDAAAEWLTGYLTDNGSEAPARDVKKAARAAGFAERTLDRARTRSGVTTGRSGFGKGAVYVWRLAASCTPLARHERQAAKGGIHGEHVGEHGEHQPPGASPFAGVIEECDHRWPDWCKWPEGSEGEAANS